MKIVFLGVGEACDERLPNTSIWVQTTLSGTRRSVLLDCGFTVPTLYWQQASDQEDLDALWISHFHGDHFFGVPALLLRFWELRRMKPLTVIGQDGIEELVNRSMDLAYPNFMQKLAYPLEFIRAEPGRTIEAVGLSWRFAENMHSQRDLTVRIDDGQHSVYYSGDGAPTEETLALADGCDLIIHEAFGLKEIAQGHGTVQRCIDFARNAAAKTLALVHVQRDERRERYSEIVELIERVVDFHVILPEPGDELEL